MALGGSRARQGPTALSSDWDLGRRLPRLASIPAPSGRLGHPGDSRPRSGRVGGRSSTASGWLTARRHRRSTCIFRDLGLVEHWLDDAARALRGAPQNGYIVGAPTYVPVGELAINRPLSGELPRPDYPEPLADAAVERWRGRASVSLMFARMHAGAAERVCCAGMLAGAVLCEAHARLAARGEWVLNEKRLVERAGLDGVQPLLGERGAEAVDAVAAALGVEPLSVR